MSSIVLTSGVFDLLHQGHIEHFHECHTLASHNQPSSEGTTLIILLNSDESVAKLKRKFPSVMDQEQRKNILMSIRLVDAVVMFDEVTPCKALRYITRYIRSSEDCLNLKSKRLLYAKGGDYSDQDILEKEVCTEENIQMLFTSNKINSSSSIYNKIREHLL